MVNRIGFDKIVIEAQLAPCPFCGQKAEARVLTESYLHGEAEFMVGCYDPKGICKIKPLAYDSIDNCKSLIANWNTRAPIPEIPQERLKPFGDSEGAKTSAPLGIRNTYGGGRFPGFSSGVSGEDLPLGSKEWEGSLRGLAKGIAECLERWADSCREDNRRGNGGN